MTAPHGAGDSGAGRGGAVAGGTGGAGGKVAAPSGDALPPIAVKPRKKLLAFLCVAFVLWIGVLVLIYIKMVYPLRHPGQSP